MEEENPLTLNLAVAVLLLVEIFPVAESSLKAVPVELLAIKKFAVVFGS